MPKLVQIDFPYQGPVGAEMAEQLGDLARSITQEPGFLWKIWTENAAAHEAGGIYLFETEETAKAYIEMHTARLGEFGVTGVNAKIFDINNELSEITNSPV